LILANSPILQVRARRCRTVKKTRWRLGIDVGDEADILGAVA
jgi:HD-like signal output (HDOD) protein